MAYYSSFIHNFLFLSIAITSTKQILGYSTTTISNQPFALVPKVVVPAPTTSLLPKIQGKEAQSVVAFIDNDQKMSKQQWRASYDLGIGKNKPVVSATQNSNIISSSQQYANLEENMKQNPTQFLVEYESVHDYPSPLDVNDNTAITSSSLSSTKPSSGKQVLPKVQYHRQSEQELTISDLSNTNHEVPILTRRSLDQQLDMNTIWVEMMIHNQQQLQLAQA